MTIRTRITAAIAAIALAIGAGFVAAPAANAGYGTTVVNTSHGYVQVQLMNGSRPWLAGYGAKAANVHSVILTHGACIQVAATRYCNGGNVQRIVNGVTIVAVKRIS